MSLLDALEQELDRLFSDSTCQGIVLHGSEKCFATGADLSAVASLRGVEAMDFARRGQLLYRRIHHAPKPVVAAVSGYCMGGAWDLALACHARLCTPETVFRHPGPAIGIFSGWGGTQRIPRFLGPARSHSLLLEGRTMRAEEARDLGLVESVALWEELFPASAALAAGLGRTANPR